MLRKPQAQVLTTPRAFLHRSVLLKLDTPSDRVRGPWHHYKCVACPDPSLHMGINVETGQVKCLRCGFKSNVRVGNGIRRHKKVPKTLVDHPNLSSFTEVKGNTSLDALVYKYMSGRGIKEVGYGWRYGRKDIVGHVVFPCVGHDGNVRYAQWRRPGPGFRYMGTPTKPCLDHYSFYNLLDFVPPEIRNLMVLVEGPVDALSIRKKTGALCSPMYGISVRLLCLDLIMTARLHGIDKVLLMLDAESGYERKSKMICRVLRRTGLGVSYVKWELVNGQDPAEMSSSYLNKHIHDRRLQYAN